MFFRHKRSGRTEYLQIVKNERVNGKPRQSVVATLGRVDELAQDGTLDRLLRRRGDRMINLNGLTAFVITMGPGLAPGQSRSVLRRLRCGTGAADRCGITGRAGGRCSVIRIAGYYRTGV